MSTATSIRFLTNKEIDRQSWDACIDASPHGLIYAYSFYLDNIAPAWSALIDERYNWAMPVISRRKIGIEYLYQPAFTQQLGIFSTGQTEVPVSAILEYLRNRYSFWEVNWNFATPGEVLPPSLKITKSTNFVIDLGGGYDHISSQYRKDLLRNLKRSEQFHLQFRPSVNFNHCIELYRAYYGKRLPHVTEDDYTAFAAICNDASDRNMLVCREVVNKEGELMAAALLLKDNRRIYNLMNTTTEAGRKNEANHFLFDALIKEFSAQHLLLDFEGSDLPGVKTFYENFGAVNQPFYQVRYNELPWLLKLLKR